MAYFLTPKMLNCPGMAMADIWGARPLQMPVPEPYRRRPRPRIAAVAINAIRRRAAATVGAGVLAIGLAGCAGMGESVGTAMALPGKYNLFTCKEIEARTRTTLAREQELQQLMARSAQGPGGEFVNVIAYQSDYVRARSELKLLAETSADKQCATQSKWSSQRSVF
jgi:hypothetical protein